MERESVAEVPKKPTAQSGSLPQEEKETFPGAQSLSILPGKGAGWGTTFLGSQNAQSSGVTLISLCLKRLRRWRLGKAVHLPQVCTVNLSSP